MEYWVQDSSHPEGGRWTPIIGSGGGFVPPDQDNPSTGGSTTIVQEIFTIVDVDIENNRFYYQESSGAERLGNINLGREFIFKLQKGTYQLDKNRIEVFINDTLYRSKESGGLKEINPETFSVELIPSEDIDPENGTKISVRYYQSLSLSEEEMPLSDTWLENINIPYQPIVTIQFNRHYAFPPTITAALLRNMKAPNEGSQFGYIHATPNIDLIINEVNGFLQYQGAVITWGGTIVSTENLYISVQIVGRK